MAITNRPNQSERGKEEIGDGDLDETEGDREEKEEDSRRADAGAGGDEQKTATATETAKLSASRVIAADVSFDLGGVAPSLLGGATRGKSVHVWIPESQQPDPKSRRFCRRVKDSPHELMVFVNQKGTL